MDPFAPGCRRRKGNCRLTVACRSDLSRLGRQNSADALLKGGLTDESVPEFYRAIREHSIATDASVGIWDFSSVTECPISADFIFHVASLQPTMPDAATRPRFIVAPAAVGFGLMRMFQIAGSSTRPLLQVVHTLDDALAALGIQSPHFEPLT